MKIIYIDLDNTLVINPIGIYVFPTIYREVSKELGIPIELIRSKVISKHVEFVAKGDIKSYDWDYIVNIVLKELGYRKSVDIYSMHVENCHRVTILDNAIDILRDLRKNGYTIVLSTNGLWKYQECVVRYSGLEEVLDDVLTPDRVGYLKSSREFFRYGISNAISIGDNLVFDIYYPKLFGLKTVLVDRGYRAEAYARALGIDLNSIIPDAIVKNLQCLPTVLEELK